MPLIQGRSKRAMSENIKTEMDAGKPQKQSIAIAYNVAKRNKRKNMASGGAVGEKKPDDKRPPEKQYMSNHATDGPAPMRKPDDARPPSEDFMSTDKWSRGSAPDGSRGSKRRPESDYMSEYAGGHFADGGRVEDDEFEDVEPVSDKDMEDEEDSHVDRVSDKDATIMYGRTNPNEDPKNLAYGGAAEDTGEPAVPARKSDDKRFPEDEYMSTDKWSKGSAPARKPDDRRLPEDEYMADHFAEGGEAEGHYDSVSSAIMAKKRRAKMMADGGTVDLDENAREEPNNEDDMSFEALKKENYSEDAGLEHMGSPVDSNQKGRKLPDEDAHDMADSFRSDVDYQERPADDTDMLISIMRKMRAKRR